MKKKLLLFPVIAFGIVLASCKGDEGTLNEIPNLIFNPKGTQALTLEATSQTYSYDVKISRSMGKEQALVIKLAVDETKLPSGKTLLKTDYYSFDNTVTMDANVGQATFTVQFKPGAMFENESEENWGKYSLPIKISTVTPEIALNADDTYVVINATLRGATLISEGATEYTEVFSGGDNATVKLIATANYSADASKVTYTVDTDGVDAFNTDNGTNLTLLPSSAYAIAAGAWDVQDVEDDEGTVIDQIDVIANTVTIQSSLTKGQYVLPLKVGTSEDGINIDQQEPVYILVESFAAATTATVINGDFESPLPLAIAIQQGFYPVDALTAAAGVWRWKPEWWSNDAEFRMSIDPNGLSDNCLLMECNPGTFDNIMIQKITGLDPSKTYTLSAKAKVTDVTDLEKSAGARVGYWPKDKTGSRDYTWGEATKSETWGEITCRVADINDNGDALIALRFGGSSADTDGKAYFDDVTLTEFTPEIIGRLDNGDFEEDVNLVPGNAVNLGGDSAGITAVFKGLDPGAMTLCNGWALYNATITQEITGAYSGSKCMKFTTEPGNKIDGGYVQRIIGLTPGDVYIFSGWAKSENVVARSYPRHNDLTGPGDYPKEEGAHLAWWVYNEDTKLFNRRPTCSEVVRNVSVWTEMTVEVTVPSTGEVFVAAYVGGSNSDMDGTFWFDNLKFEKKP